MLLYWLVIILKRDLTQGSVFKNIIWFSLPFLLSYFLQTLYGLADLFIIGQFNGSDVITAVSIGSQVMHFVTVVIVGLAMGSTVIIGKAVGSKDKALTAKTIGNTASLFMAVAIAMTVILLALIKPIVSAMSTPAQAVEQTVFYLAICFAGIPFITAYNIISSIFRGMGDSKSPMYFIALACALNIILDYVFIGLMDMKASGAALGTVIAQGVSVITALLCIRFKNMGIHISKSDLKIDKSLMLQMLKIGVPVAFQDAFIQISFLTITIIANKRGVDVAAAVGIVEKIIGLLFLVPSSMLSSVSALAAQNIGANQHKRASKTLFYGTAIAVGFGLVVGVAFQFVSDWAVGLFTTEQAVIIYGEQYLKSYAWDCMIAGVHFCFSGYFCAYSMSMVSFVHNVASIVLMRVPGAILATQLFPDNLYPMGMAAPLGSLVSALICIGVYIWFVKSKRSPLILSKK